MKLPLQMALFFCLIHASLIVSAAETMSKIKTNQNITVGYREATFPFSFLDKKKKPVGYAIDICELLVDAVKRELKEPKLKLTYLPVNAETRMSTVIEGKADIECGTTTNNIERRKQVSFIIPHFYANVRFITRSDSNIKNWTDFNGKPIALIKGSSTAKLLAENPRTKTIKFTTVEAADHEAAFRLLETNQAKAFVMDDVLLYGLRAGAKNHEQYTIAGDVLLTQTYAFVVRKNDPQFKDFLDKELARLMVSGEIGKLYEKWFKKPTQPNGINLEMPLNPILLDQMRYPSFKDVDL
nr:amino acid ABC transporter substrate-binding protein [uncultured Undibacterium sp.]